MCRNAVSNAGEKSNCKTRKHILLNHRKTPFRLTNAFHWLPNPIKVTGHPKTPTGSFTTSLEPPGQTQINGVFYQFGFNFHRIAERIGACFTQVIFKGMHIPQIDGE